MDKEISHALSSRIKKSTRTAFWYQLNDLIHKIHEYKTRFEDENNCKDNRGKNKRPKKVSKRSNTNNKSIVEKKIDCETIYNETESKQGNESYFLIALLSFLIFGIALNLKLSHNF